MKTTNNNINVMADESLQEPLEILVAELKQSSVRQYTCINDMGYSQLERNIVEKLTNWQQAKDKATIDKLIEALKVLNDTATCFADDHKYYYEKGNQDKIDEMLAYFHNAHLKANKLLQQIEQQ